MSTLVNIQLPLSPGAAAAAARSSSALERRDASPSSPRPRRDGVHIEHSPKSKLATPSSNTMSHSKQPPSSRRAVAVASSSNSGSPQASPAGRRARSRSSSCPPAPPAGRAAGHRERRRLEIYAMNAILALNEEARAHMELAKLANAEAQAAETVVGASQGQSSGGSSVNAAGASGGKSGDARSAASRLHGV
jgi:hypothetical protein